MMTERKLTEKIKNTPRVKKKKNNFPKSNYFREIQKIYKRNGKLDHDIR